MADRLRAGLQKVFDDNEMGLLAFGKGPMWHMLFTENEPTNWVEVIAAANPKMAVLEREFLKHGLFVLPGNRRFISIHHNHDDLEATFEVADRVCRKLRS